MIQRAITDAGHTVRQATRAAREFAATAAVEWQRIVTVDSGSGAWGEA